MECIKTPPPAGPGGATVQEGPEDTGNTRHRILAAAERAFVSQGFHVATMDTIARGAQCSKKTVYKLFASKEDLFRALMRAKKTEMGQLPIDATLPPGDALRAFILRLAGSILGNAAIALMRIAMAEAGQTPALLQERTGGHPEAARLALEGYLSDLQREGTYHFGPSEDAARMLIGMALGAFHHELVVGLEVEVPEAALTARVERAVTIFLRGSRAVPAVP
jgi:AcrR family transcriptional regulator